VKYRVRITATAFEEVEEAIAWLEARSPSAAKRWREALLEAVDSLGASPARYPLAPESPFRGREIRQLLHGKRRGVYRILYEIRGDTVHVLHVRHGAKRFLDEE
jgi:plasmid stabilization system protein ParE